MFLFLQVQKFDAGKLDFENGVFLGPIAHLTFNGPYAMSGRQLTFDVHTMNIGVGPLKFSIPLKKDGKSIADMDSGYGRASQLIDQGGASLCWHYLGGGRRKT
jgi:hypothetical protein